MEKEERSYRCPHCGEAIGLDELEAAVAQLKRQQHTSCWDQPLARRPERGEEAFDIWARKPASSHRGRSTEDDANPFAAAMKPGSLPVEERPPPPKPAREPNEPPRTSTETDRPRIDDAVVVTAKPQATAVAAAPPSGPTLLDVLDTDPTLNPGQRETIRTIYVRFAPAVQPAPKAPEGLTLAAALKGDPNLNDGQRETLRIVIERFTQG